MFFKSKKLIQISILLAVVILQIAVKTNAQQAKAISLTYQYAPAVIVLPQTKRSVRTIFVLTAPNTSQNPQIDFKLFRKIATEWLAKNQENKVIEVFTGSFTSKIRGAYIWVISIENSLNIELVRTGACNAESMFVDQEDENKLLVNRSKYEEFKKQVSEAQSLAKKEKLGIWSKTN